MDAFALPPDPEQERYNDEEIGSADAIHDLTTIGHTPAVFGADHVVSQFDLSRNLYPPHAEISKQHEEKFEKSKHVPTKLSTFKRWYNNHKKYDAMESLLSKQSVVIDDNMQIPPRDGSLMWRISSQFLDFECAISSGIGLAAFIPTVTSHLFKFELNLHHRNVQFRGKNALIGFDTKGRCLKIAKNSWIIMAPNSYVEGHDPVKATGYCTGDTRLSEKHYRQLVAFLTLALNSLTSKAFQARSMYHIPLEGSVTWESYTNVMEPGVDLSLTRPLLKDLDRFIRHNYDYFVDAMPRNWKEDGFFEGHSPLSCFLEYGQNQPFGSPHDIERNEEEATFHGARDYSKIAHFSFAPAIQLSAYHVDEDDWEPVNPVEIKRKFGTVFTHWDTGVREEIHNLDTLPLVDDSGCEIRLYTNTGIKIARRTAPASCLDDPRGILVNLTSIHKLFVEQDIHGDDEDDSDSDTPSANQPKVSIFPQAFLHSHGQIQAKGGFYTTEGYIDRLCRAVQEKHPNHAINNGQDLHPNWRPLNDKAPISVVSTQLYNEVFHRLTPHAAALEIQRAKMTNYLTGFYVEDPRLEKKFEKRQQYMEGGRPWQRLDEMIDTDNIGVALRYEIVFSTSLKNIHPDWLANHGLYRLIIANLLRFIRKDANLDMLKDHLTVFEEGVFPNLYKWTTHPLNSFMESVYESSLLHLEKMTKPSPYLIELIAALERALVFAWTGNPKVLERTVGNDLFVTLGLIKHGFPMINSSIVGLARRAGQEHRIFPSYWPMRLPGPQPAMSSTRSQILTWGKQQLALYSTHFHIVHLEHMPDSELYKDVIRSSRTRYAINIAHLGISAWLQDLKLLVEAGALASIDRADPAVHYTQLRQDSFQQFAAMSHLLAFVAKSYNVVVRTVVEDHTNIPGGLPGCDRRLSTVVLAQLLVKEASNTVTPTPYVSYGSGQPAMRVVIEYLTQLGNGNIDWPAGCIARALNLVKIKFLPWKGGQGSRGAPSRTSKWNQFISLSTAADNESLRVLAVDPEEQIIIASQSAEDAFLRSDPSRDWSFTNTPLSQLADLLIFTSLPTDWDIPSGFTGILLKTYQWIQINYNPNKPSHLMAIIIAFIVGHSTPLVGFNMDYAKRVLKDKDWTESSIIAREIPWIIPLKKQRGGRGGPIMSTMLMAMIIALYDPKSPLNEDLVQKKTHSLGNDWTSQHGSRSVTFFLLFRTGAVAGWGAKPVASAKWKRDVKPWSDKEIEAKVANWTNLLYRGNDGVAAVINDVMGNVRGGQMYSNTGPAEHVANLSYSEIMDLT